MIKNTKEKILQSALSIFNEKGYKNTTLRSIAKGIGISQGNLNYHYKTKGEILEELYFNLVEKLENEIGKMHQSLTVLEMIFDSSKISMACLYDNRFLMRDLHTIMKENDKICQHYSELQSVRTKQFDQIFKNLILHEILRPEEFKHEYQRLYVRMNIIGDNWINTQELLNKEIEDPIEYYQLLLFEVIFPYLTTKGKAEFYRITNC